MALNMLRRPESSQEVIVVRGDWEGIQCNPKAGENSKRYSYKYPQAREIALYMKGTLSTLLGELQFLEALVTSGMKQIGGRIPKILCQS
ncbi:hypothetical protein IFM89_005962 [Coptis chinensis]|uniref:Uncharacterized protein n=1 Tax=Coptis chinensis TaxID=261450 RepID=A0A835HCE8_9MAGN|nr:hypothetical protein IFM89_005962 [Coptis chinensis]